MAGFLQIHYVAPLSMVGALLAGFVLALGHHLFYASLAGTVAPTGTYDIAGANISKQQLNTAVGTAFGFLVKSCLTITTSIAFVQAFWRAIWTSRKGPTIASLDSTYTLLSDFLGLFKPSVWLHFPVPMLLAFIAWCTPIASIITPATLSVQTALVTPAPSQLMQVPNLDLTNLDFVAPMAEGPSGFCFNGPSQPVRRVAAAVAAQGEILRIQPPESNVSWALEFAAPSLRCHEVEGAQRSTTFNNILNNWANVSNCAHAPGYLAWTGETNMTTPFTRTEPPTSGTVFQSAPFLYGVPASLYVATMPQIFDVAFVPSTAQTGEMCNFVGSNSLMYSYPIADDLCLPGQDRPACYGQEAWLTDATLIQCDLVNSTYSVAFEYAGETQTIDVITGSPQDNGEHTSIVPRECFTSPDPAEFRDSTLACNGTQLGQCTFNTAANRLLSYQGIASAFSGKQIHVVNPLGSATSSQDRGVPISCSHWSQLAVPSEVEREVLGRGRNEAMLFYIMGGYSVPTPDLEVAQIASITSKTPGLFQNSSITTTILMDTEQMAFVSDFNGVNKTYTYLQLDIGQPNASTFHGVSNKLPAGQRGDLRTALQTLFENITISFMAEDYLQPNYSSPYAPAQLTNVTFNRYHNVYEYSTRTLWVAYGLAILFTVLSLVIGIISIALNQGSFRNDFSTVLRTTKTAALSIDVLESETDGRQPVPRHLAKARIRVGLGTATLDNATKLPTASTSLLSQDSVRSRQNQRGKTPGDLL
ncbi:hypothetical protein LTR15_003000 [Elasticomyces elasticus]|nr:hypothetical protein LTR15_003000 [Elasticomyces elasticus]